MAPSTGSPERQTAPRMTTRRYGPPPAATPSAALTHTVAAVVSPCTPSRLWRIVPAPRKPIPLTIWAAIRVPSAAPGASITDIIVKIAAPSAMRMLVRKPALLRRSSRSAPNSPPTAAASSSLWMSSVSESGVIFFLVALSLLFLGSGGPMLWTAVVLLLILWLLGFTLHVAVGFVHVLLVIALVVIVLRLLTGRRV